MVIFDQLKISDNGREMHIGFHINKADYFNNIYLESLTIMVANQVSETDPLTPTADFIYQVVFDENIKEYNTVLLSTDFNENFTGSSLSNDLFFVYVKCKDAPIIGCPPCRLDELTTLGVTFDENLLHQKVLSYTKELAENCNISKGFIDLILLWQAFRSSVETEHYIQARKYWEILFSNNRFYSSKGCNCYGKNSI